MASRQGVGPSRVEESRQALPYLDGVLLHLADRVGTTWEAHQAADNAACYPGTGRRPSYAQVYEAV